MIRVSGYDAQPSEGSVWIEAAPFAPDNLYLAQREARLGAAK